MNEKQVIRAAKARGVKRQTGPIERLIVDLQREFAATNRIHWQKFISIMRYTDSSKASREIRQAWNRMYDIVANLGGRERGNPYVWPVEKRTIPRIQRLLGAALNIIRSQGE